MNGKYQPTNVTGFVGRSRLRPVPARSLRLANPCVWPPQPTAIPRPQPSQCYAPPAYAAIRPGL